MAVLIIEIPGRHTALYHKIDKPTVRVGRALDNDLILSDPTVSPYHFEIRRDESGSHTLYPVADENGIRIKRRQVRQPLVLNQLPLEFDAGRTRVRILDQATTVSPTRLISCGNGGACVFGHWGWALLLFAVMALLTSIDHYLSTPRILDWESYGSELTFTLFFVVAMSIGMLLMTRFVAQRWDYPSALSLVSLILIGALLLEWLLPAVDYFFTSTAPGIVIELAWVLLLLPLLLGWFLLRLHHGNTTASILVVALLLAPAAFVHVRDFVKQFNIPPGFSKTAYYSKSLHPWDRRLQPTISIDEYSRLTSHLASRQKKEK